MSSKNGLDLELPQPDIGMFSHRENIDSSTSKPSSSHTVADHKNLVLEEITPLETRVLYVEDSLIFRSLMKAVCKRINWQLTTVNTGQEGVDLALNYEFELVLMDIELGPDSELDGYETARKIKAVKPHLLIVSFSSIPQAERVRLGPEMDSHIEKNADGKYLLKTLEPLLL